MTVQLRAGVGDGQPNHPEDVALVQLLLNGTDFGGLAVSGTFDGPTSNAVAAFQRNHFGFTDRIVTPGDITFLRLRGAASGDPLLEAQRDMIIRALAVHFAEGGSGGAGEVPLDTLRPTADGQGMVGQWTFPDRIGHIFSHPRFATWEVHGAILTKYLEIGEESSELGNPISGERKIPPGPSAGSNAAASSSPPRMARSSSPPSPDPR